MGLEWEGLAFEHSLSKSGRKINGGGGGVGFFLVRGQGMITAYQPPYLVQVGVVPSVTAGTRGPRAGKERSRRRDDQTFFCQGQFAEHCANDNKI